LFSSARGAAQGHHKSFQTYLDLVKLLIARGADVNVKLKTGKNILPVVARQFSEKHASEVCELLIVNGVKVNEKNSQGRTPLDEALEKNRNITADLLRKHGGKIGDELKAEWK
jgi:ankyrin repeat protein